MQYMEVDGARPRKTWLEVVKNDMKSFEEDCGGYVLTQVCLELPGILPRMSGQKMTAVYVLGMKNI